MLRLFFLQYGDGADTSSDLQRERDIQGLVQRNEYQLSPSHSDGSCQFQYLRTHEANATYGHWDPDEERLSILKPKKDISSLRHIIPRSNHNIVRKI